MIKRSLVFALIAVVSAVFLVTGCSQSTDGGGSSAVVAGGWLVDIQVETEDELLAAFLNPDYQVIGLKIPDSDITLDPAKVTEIPAGKTVVIYGDGKLIPSTSGLEIKGALIVEGGATLAATSTAAITVTTGYIEVNNGGLSVPALAYSGSDTSILGTSKIYFNAGTLTVASVPSLSSVKAAFNLVPKGEVIITAVDNPVIKPSELVAIQTTATRRLTITGNLTDAGDTVDALKVPAGLSFTSADPLINLKTLDVAGSLTLSAAKLTDVTALTVPAFGSLTGTAALFGSVETLEVAGAISASASANYDSVTTLEVSSEFDAGSASFGGLERLTVSTTGEFTTTGSIGTAGADAAATLLTIEGEASVGDIKKLASSTISGSLTATGFTPAAEATLKAAAGGIINGVKFPSEAAIAALGADAVTLTAYEVPASKVLDIDAATTLTVKGTLDVKGSVVTGNGTNDVTIAKAVITGAAEGGVTFLGGAVTLGANESLALAGGGSVLIAGTGVVTVGTTFTLDGAGAWTAGGDVVTFAAGGTANTASITGGTSATLTPSTATANLTLIGATEVQALTIGGTTQFTLDLSVSGKITFGSSVANSTIKLATSTDGIKLSSILAIIGGSNDGNDPFPGGIVDGTGSYNSSTLNVALIDGTITQTGTTPNPGSIDKNTAATSLASTTS